MTSKRAGRNWAWLLVLLGIIAFVSAGVYFLGALGGFVGFFIGMAVLYALEHEAYGRGFKDGYERAETKND